MGPSGVSGEGGRVSEEERDAFSKKIEARSELISFIFMRSSANKRSVARARKVRNRSTGIHPSSIVYPRASGLEIRDNLMPSATSKRRWRRAAEGPVTSAAADGLSTPPSQPEDTEIPPCLTRPAVDRRASQPAWSLGGQSQDLDLVALSRQAALQ
jgi:hypothetical protein